LDELENGEAAVAKVGEGGGVTTAVKKGKGGGGLSSVAQS